MAQHDGAEGWFMTVEILQPGEGIPADSVYLAASPTTVLWGRLPCADDAPVLTVPAGTSVVIDTVSHEGILEDQGKDPRAFFGAHGIPPHDVLHDAVQVAESLARDPERDGPHVVTGPIRVEGARVGDLLRITVEGLQPRVGYGVVSNRHGRGALVGELPREGRTVSVFVPVEERGGRLSGLLPVVEGGARVVEFPLAPFLGTMGVAVAAGERPHSVPPGSHGGNIDINLLTEGAVLYLPVQVDGALAYVGDPHFAQGDGEVALTALEASLRATLRFDVVPRARALAEFGEVSGPLVRTADYLVPTGLDRDLDEALRQCVRASISLLRARWGMDEHLAYAYLSAATDFDISQVVDIVCGVHARIRESDFAAVPRGAVDDSVWRVVGDPLLSGERAGSLAGLTVAVKDLFAVAGHRVGAGNPVRLAAAPVESHSAAAVVALTAAGAAVRGIAQTDEFAYSIAGDNVHYGTPPNGAVPGALPGGSSSGPASAVATRDADVGLATDTAGSIRVPASYQGLWGLRTTHGAVPVEGVLPLAPSFDTVGWITRDGETLQRVVDECLGRPRDTALPGFAVAEEVVAAAEPATRDAFEGLIARFVDLGVHVDRVSVGDLDAYLDAFRTAQGAEAWRLHGEWVEQHPGALGSAVAARFSAARGVTSDDESVARAAVATLAARLSAIAERSVLLMPTVPGAAPRAGLDAASMEAIRRATMQMTTPASIAGVPALTVPLLDVPHSGGHAPVGLCLVSARGTDSALVEAGLKLVGLLRG